MNSKASIAKIYQSILAVVFYNLKKYLQHEARNAQSLLLRHGNTNVLLLFGLIESTCIEAKNTVGHFHTA